MKELTNFLIEKLSTKCALPQLGGHKVAYDRNGDGWIVDAFCYADGGAPEGCNSLEKLLRDYDISGAIKQWLDDNDDPDVIIVGAHLEDDEDEIEAEIWGPTGMCYENKPKK